MNPIKLNEQWFKDRIGKRVYRTSNKCKCDNCTTIYEDGLVIDDEIHAEFINDMYNDYNIEGIDLKYFDTIEDRNSYESD